MKNTMLLATVAASFSVATVASANLVITEIMANPAGVYDAEGEWFEAHNAGSEDLDLEGIRFVSNGTQSFTVAGDHILAPGAYYVFGPNADFLTNGGVDVDYRYDYYHFSLSDKSDLISATYNGEALDTAIYANAAYGRTLFLPNVTLDNSMESNWYHSNIAVYEGANNYINHGTPGYANEELLIVDLLDETFEAALGSRFSFRVEIHNPTDHAIDFDAWVRGTRGTDIDVVVKSVQGITIAPQQTVGQVVELSVPSQIETGLYTIVVELGDFSEAMGFWHNSYEVMITE